MTATNVSHAVSNHHAYKDIYEQYVVNASFLWVLRSIVLEQPHYYPDDMRQLEQRIDAQLDGLMTSTDLGWQLCEEALELQEPGEVFTAMVVAMRSGDTGKIQTVVEAGLGVESALPGLVSAMGWLPATIADTWVQRFLRSKEIKHKYLGIASCSIRRQTPGDLLTHILQREDCRQDDMLYARALRLTGELRRQDCLPLVNKELDAEIDAIRFWANWSATLLGSQTNAQVIKSFVMQSGPYQALAIQLAFRVLPVEKARQWISALAKDEAQIRASIKATGVLGDPHAVNWLIGKMQESTIAKLAAEAFSFITGINLEEHQLAVEEPEDSPAIPNDDPADGNVDLDEDENLPYPDVEKVAAFWRKSSQNFTPGQRYLMGKPVSSEVLKHTLVHGSQRQRHAAAMELILSDSHAPLVNTRARVV